MVLIKQNPAPTIVPPKENTIISLTPKNMDKRASYETSSNPWSTSASVSKDALAAEQHVSASTKVR